MNKSLAENTLTAKLPVCLLNERVITLTDRLLVWDLPAGERSLVLGGAGNNVSELIVPWPRLLCALLILESGVSQLRLVALRRRSRIDVGTPVFHPPLMNISEDGTLCTQDRLPFTCIDPRCIEQYECEILKQIYTQVLHGRTVRPAGMAAGAPVNTYHHGRFWREMAREKLSRFPGHALVPKKQTIADWLTELTISIENAG